MDEWKTQRNLIELAFKGNNKKVPTPDMTRLEHARQVLKERIGCDFTIISVGNEHGLGGVEWAVHSAWILGTSQALQKGLFIDGVKNPTAPAHIRLEFSPVILDRIVEHIYLGTYHLDKGGRLLELHQATKVPTHDRSIHALQDMPSYKVHLQMYLMGEAFEYPALMATAYAKMTELCIVRRRLPPSTIKTLVDLTYGPPGTRICEDKDGLLQHLVVTAAIVHGKKDYTEEQVNELTHLTKHDVAFCADAKQALEEHYNLIALPNDRKEQERQKKRKRKA